MKETKEDKILKIMSSEEETTFRNIATGRRFFKVGERVIDICEQEIERFRYEHAGLLTRLFKKSKFRNKQEKYMLESRVPSAIRSVAAYCLQNDEETFLQSYSAKDLAIKVKQYILEVVEEYHKKEKEKPKKGNNVIDIYTKNKKEA